VYLCPVCLSAYLPETNDYAVLHQKVRIFRQ